MLDFDEVWCVFDRDEHSRFHEACVMARDNGYGLAVSNPCFELWILLHFQESPDAQDHHKVQSMVRGHIPDYAKHLKFETLAPMVAEASSRARRLDEDATRMGEPGRNPSTGVYKITDSIARGGT